MTYISISDRIKTLEASGQLTRYVPRSRKKPGRRLYLADRALKDLTDSSSAVNLLVGRGYIEAALVRWTLKERVFGDKKGGRFLKRLEAPPPEIWEIRVTEPIVHGRLLGRFAEPDTLILDKLYTRQYLGEKGSWAWKTAMKECEHNWNNLFNGAPPFSSNVIHDYVTEKCDDFPI